MTALVVALSSVDFSAQPPQPPGVDEIVAKYLAAKGGAEKLRAINTVKTTGRIKGPGGESPLTVWAKRPNMMRRDSTRDGQTLTIAFDGKTVWTVNSMMGSTPREITGQIAEMTRQDADDFDPVLLDYKQKGYTVDLVGTESVNGLPAYHLRVTKKNGRVQDIYLNTETLLESRITMKFDQLGKTGTAAIEFSDYKPVDGIMVPFSLRQSNNGQVVGEVIYKDVQFNVPIDDGIFTMPK
jgi:outer membrane lipoprotein-sorting protein